MKKVFFLLLLVFTSKTFAEPTKVAFLAALTGMDPNTARELHRGLEVFKRQKPELSKLVDVSINDTQGDLQKTYQIMSDLKNKGYKVFVGLANSNEAMVAAKFASTNSEVVFITPFATNPQVTQISDRVFRICFDDDKQGEFLSSIANKKFKGKSILVLENIDSIYSKGLSKSFRAGIKDKASMVSASYSSTSFDPATVLTAVSMSKAKLVFIPDSSSNAAIVVREIFKFHKDIQFLGGDGWGGNAVFHAIQGKDEKLKIIYSTYWHKDMRSAENTRFQKGYKSLFAGSLPSSGAAFTYDAFHLAAEALKNSISTKKAQPYAKVLANTRILSTTGPLSYSGTSRTPDRPIVLMQLNKGDYVVYR